jgi:hypothetical protein
LVHTKPFSIDRRVPLPCSPAPSPSAFDRTDVHERCWKCEPVQDSALLVRMIDICIVSSLIACSIATLHSCIGFCIFLMSFLF